MDIEFRDHVAANVATGKPVAFEQSRVIVDGAHAGWLFWKNGFLGLSAKLPPKKRREVEAAASEYLETKNIHAAELPEVPAELLQPESDTETYDDFD